MFSFLQFAFLRLVFDRLYGGDHLARVKAAHDPDGRLTSLYDKVVQRR